MSKPAPCADCARVVGWYCDALWLPAGRGFSTQQCPAAVSRGKRGGALPCKRALRGGRVPVKMVRGTSAQRTTAKKPMGSRCRDQTASTRSNSGGALPCKPDLRGEGVPVKMVRGTSARRTTAKKPMGSRCRGQTASTRSNNGRSSNSTSRVMVSPPSRITSVRPCQSFHTPLGRVKVTSR